MPIAALRLNAYFLLNYCRISLFPKNDIEAVLLISGILFYLTAIGQLDLEFRKKLGGSYEESKS